MVALFVRILGLLFFSVGIVACASGPAVDSKGNPIVNIDRVLWEPGSYDGQKVNVRGYLISAGVDTGLYRTYCATVDPPSLEKALSFSNPTTESSKVLRGTEVDVVGRIVASDKGRYGRNPASIEVEEIRYVRTIFYDDDRCRK